MRAIDADALIAKCGNWYCEEGTEDGFIGDIKHLIDAQPTIEPRKKGKWYEITESDCSGYDPVLAGYEDPVVGFVCSCCGYGEEKEVMGETLWNFCPNCGADMRGGEDDDNGTD